MEEIKHCPFCGESVAFIYESRVDIFAFHCPSCKVRAHFGYTSASIHYGSKDRARVEALKAWNKRKQAE